jgi:16S rRNA (cytidine1402-2'-O)-methyltransferase
LSGKLYIVPTPIGNLQDMTFRGIEVLKNVDIIACEDTRHTLKLLNFFEIKKKLVSYFEHNKFERGEFLVSTMKEGKNIALVSDAGIPGISDPGEDLVRLCVKEGVPVIPLPGACAFVTALVASGHETGRFVFEGFLPMNKVGRKKRLEELKKETRTIIFYEAPHKLLRTLKDLMDFLGNRNIVLARELTKIHEEFLRTDIKSALEIYLKNKRPKGEYVLVIEGVKEDSMKELRDEIDEIDVVQEVHLAMKKGVEKNEAIKQVAKQYGLNKREVYMKVANGLQ